MAVQTDQFFDTSLVLGDLLAAATAVACVDRDDEQARVRAHRDLLRQIAIATSLKIAVLVADMEDDERPAHRRGRVVKRAKAYWRWRTSRSEVDPLDLVVAEAVGVIGPELLRLRGEAA